MIKFLTRRNTILFLIIAVSVLVRFYKLGSVPSGFHHDEVSQSYNAFAIGETLHDRYGQYLPILFRSFGSYQPPVHTYLAWIPIKLLGNTIFAARFLSALCGVISVFFTYLIVQEAVNSKERHGLALSAAFAVAISPWAIYFSRRVVEGNVGLAFFLISLFIFIKSLKNIKYFPWFGLFLALSTHAYYSERLIAIIFLPLLLFVYRKYFWENKKTTLAGLVVFGTVMIPHVWIATTGALSKRLTQVSYINDDTNEWRAIYIFRQFVRHISNYLSPKNLFSDTRESFNPISPDLASFYSWFILPMVMGVRKITKKIPGELIKILSVLFVVSLIPAALTGDEFYPLRALEFLWVLSVVVGVGLYYILTFFKSTIARVILCFVIVIYTLSTLYVSFVVLFQYETTEYIGDTYIKLEEYLSKYGDKKIVIDSARDYAAGLRIAYFRAYNPNKLAAVLAPQMKSDYYSEDVNFDETYIIDNIEVRPIVFGEDTCLENGILVGDTLAINDEQAKEHLLTLEFEIAANNGQVVLKGYSTNPELKCK